MLKVQATVILDIANINKIEGVGGLIMKIQRIHQDFSICQVEDYSLVNLESKYCFIEKTDEEKSLVCLTNEVPSNVIRRDDGWRAFCIQGILEFSLIGILSKIVSILADHHISIYTVSTYNIDYIFLKKENYQKGLEVLEAASYQVID